MPAVIAETIPVALPTVTIAVHALLHLPPVVALVSIVVVAAQTFVMPPIAAGVAFIVTVVVT